MKTHMRVACAGSPRKGGPQGGLAGLYRASRLKFKPESKQANALSRLHHQSTPGAGTGCSSVKCMVPWAPAPGPPPSIAHSCNTILMQFSAVLARSLPVSH